jgi:hypothetical protein
MAKIAFGQEPVSSGVFASDQLKPLVCYTKSEGVDTDPPTLSTRADPLPSGASPKSAFDVFVVMEVNEDLVAESDPQADWRTPYLDCLLRELLPADKIEARCLACRTKSFAIVNGELYKKSHTKILQHCIPTEQGRKLLNDIHGGVCGHHARPRTLVGKAF